MGEEMCSGYAATLEKREQVSAFERRNALTFEPYQLSRQFERWLVLEGVGIKIPYSQGTCENQLDFGQFSPLPPEKQLLFAWQHPSCTKPAKMIHSKDVLRLS